MLTGLFGFGLAQRIGTVFKGCFPSAVGCCEEKRAPGLGLLGWVRVHLLTLPVNAHLKPKAFLKSSWLGALACLAAIDSVHFLQKFVACEPTALRHQAGAGRQQANYPRGIHALGPQAP